MQQHTVGLIVGSLRQASWTRMLARNLPELAPASMQLIDIPIGDLPHYNEDLETTTPPSPWSALRHAVSGCDAMLFVTPEYNRSIPGALKNALDVGSRPWGKSVWSGKPAGVISATPGALGAMAANHHLRQVLYAVNLAAMPYPEAYIPAAATLFDGAGRLHVEETRAFLRSFLEALERWIAQHRAA